MCICPFFGHAEGNLRVLCFKSDRHLLFHSVAGMQWPEGLAYNNGGLHSSSLDFLVCLFSFAEALGMFQHCLHCILKGACSVAVSPRALYCY